MEEKKVQRCVFFMNLVNYGILTFSFCALVLGTQPRLKVAYEKMGFELPILTHWVCSDLFVLMVPIISLIALGKDLIIKDLLFAMTINQLLNTLIFISFCVYIFGVALPFLTVHI